MAGRSFQLTDQQLVETDLLNHIFTRKGERIMMPDFGTLIPDLPFEPLDQITLDIIKRELTKVVKFDPRLKLLNLTVTPNYNTNSVTANLLLNYVELNMTDRLTLNIDVGTN
jgi:phage baseplate assembly protein W